MTYKREPFSFCFFIQSDWTRKGTHSKAFASAGVFILGMQNLSRFASVVTAELARLKQSNHLEKET